VIKNELKSNSLLWKISGNGLINTSYLFGTMHLIPKKDFGISKKVAKTLKLCQELILELNLTNIKEMEKAQQMQVTNNRISDGLNKNESLELNLILEKAYSISLSEVNHLSPMMVMNKMVTSSFEEEEMTAIDMELIDLAIRSKIKIKGLETVKAQIKIAQKIFTPKELLRQMRMGEDYPEVIKAMIGAYKNGDLSTLHELIKDRRFMTEEAEKVMVTNRNKLWARKMPQLLSKEKSIFFAVGAGHLGGENGLIVLLRKHGFNLRPLKF
jgi:hypothetical protein